MRGPTRPHFDTPTPLPHASRRVARVPGVGVAMALKGWIDFVLLGQEFQSSVAQAGGEKAQFERARRHRPLCFVVVAALELSSLVASVESLQRGSSALAQCSELGMD